MAKITRWLTISLIAWAIFSVGVFTLGQNEIPFPFEIILILGVYLAGVILFLFSLSQADRKENRTGALVVAAAAVVLTICFFNFGDTWGVYIRYQFSAGRFQAIATKLEKENVNGVKKSLASTPEYQVDNGPPFRVAFHWSGTGHPLGRSIVVYDSSDTLSGLAAKGSRVRTVEQADPNVRQLFSFGGRVLICRRLKDKWYYCYLR